MKKIFFSIFALSLSINNTFAGQNSGLLNGVTPTDIKEGNIHIGDIPNIIGNAIDFFFGIAGTIAIIFVIIGAYKVLFGSLTQDKTKGKDTIVMAIVGFVLAAMSWTIIQFIFANVNL